MSRLDARPTLSADAPAAPPAGAPVVLVLGASGRLGAAAVAAFAAAGWRVVAQRRGDGPGLPGTARAFHGGLDDVDALARAADGARVVVHAVNPAYTRWATEAMPALDAGLAVARRLGARLVLPGNVYGYGEGMPAVLRADTPQRPTTRKGAIRQRLEARLRDAAATGTPCAVLRAGDFFGAGTGSWLDLAVARDLVRGRLVYPGPLDVPHAWAYVPDLARALVALADADRGRSPTGTVPLAAWEDLGFAGHTVTGGELLAAVEAAAERLGVQPAGGWRHGAMPWGLIRAGGWFVPMWRELAEMAYLWRVPHALDGDALAARVGPVPSTPLPQAMAAALTALGAGAADTRARPRPA